MAEDRCWPGYEPVKGKKKHEQGSCRPKRKKQLDEWQAEHPKTRRSAAQHLPAPKAGKAKPKK
jgi:hypothetical protein